MKTLRVRLNHTPMGPLAGFFLAEDRNYFAGEGLEIEWSGARGASAAIADIRTGDYDAVYGDINSLTMLLSALPEGTGPQAVFVAFNRTPLTVAVRADGPVQTPRDLIGKTLFGHPHDSARIFFPVYARAVGFDVADADIRDAQGSLGQLVRAMIEDKAGEGVFGFVNSTIASLSDMNSPHEANTRFLEYSSVLPDFYGNALVVTRSLLEADPAGIRSLVRATSRGFRDAIRDPRAGIDAVMAHGAEMSHAVNLRRFMGTLEREMSHPERERLGIGDVDQGRLARSCEQVTVAMKLDRKVGAAELFSPAFLPALEVRRFEPSAG
jgi:NitT/TauT family transport system substrate-binding protein